jgi:hypothetical protein
MLALLNRALLIAAELEPARAILGPSGTAPDNLIAMAVNGLVALYFWRILRMELPVITAKDDFMDVRRLYRHLWVIYGLLMTILGAQQVLRFIFFVPTDVLGDVTRETTINGLALLLVGTPIWVYAWSVVQHSLDQESEHDSNLRLSVLYILALSGVITVITSAAIALRAVLSWLFAGSLAGAQLVNSIGGPLSIGLPLGAVWAYYGHWLGRHINSITGAARRAGMKRVNRYILSAVGLGGAFIGVATLIKFIIDRLTGGSVLLDESLRSSLASALALVAAWTPLWLITWRSLQSEAAAQDDEGDHARRSIVRRAYLYLALFAGVIGGMVAAVAMVFQLINTALTGHSDPSFAASVLNDLQLLVLFSLLIVYHLGVMRRDGRFAAAALARRQKAFKVVVVGPGRAFGAAVKGALAKVAPDVPVTVAARAPRGKFQAMVVSGSRLLDAPPWVRAFTGQRIVVPEGTSGLYWAGGAGLGDIQKAALAVRQLAEGQGLPRQAGRSGWMIVVYVAAALFGLEIIFMLLALIISTFID